jgi:hypothetical protein
LDIHIQAKGENMRRILYLVFGILIMALPVYAADNFEVTAGTGTNMGTDEVAGSVHITKVKLIDATADSTAATGVAASPLQVSLANHGANAVPVLVDLGAADTLGTVTTVGAVTAITNALPAGTNAIGKLSANTGVDIGDVDVLSIAAGTNVIGKVRLVTALGDEITEDTGDTIKVSATNLDIRDLASASDSVAAVCTNAGTFAVQAVCTNAGTFATQVTGDALTALQLVDNLAVAVDGNYLNTNMNIAGTDVVGNSGVNAAGVQRVTIATDDEINDDLDTIAGDTTAIETAIQIMDDWDATHASAAPADGAAVMGAGYSTGLPTDVGADADAARLCTDRFGRLLNGLQPQNFQASVSISTTNSEEVKAATADRKMYITSILVSASAACNVTFEDSDGTDLIKPTYLAANGGFTLNFPEGTPLVVPSAKGCHVHCSTTSAYSVTIVGYLAP